MPSQWTLAAPDEALARSLSSRLCIAPITAKVLINRGCASAEDARKFLNPSLSDIPDPYLLPDMEKAAQRLALAVERGERVAIFGDYDTDGVTGSALLEMFLKELGVSAKTFLPCRQAEGYGLSKAAVQSAKDIGASLLVTVDNGTRAVEEIEFAKGLGLDVVVTDHHMPSGRKPDAVAIVNPALLGRDSPLMNLSGCGAAFMLSIALRRKLRSGKKFSSAEPNLKKFLDLVALGTIADVVPLTGVNRILASFGLKEISACKRPGIKALLDVSAANPADVTAETVAFRLAPRINAAGRMADPITAFELLTSTDIEISSAIAQELNSANSQRQCVEEKILGEIYRRFDADPHVKKRPAIVMYSEGWHVGVIGIVASKLTDALGVPSVVISCDVSPARGSARSVAGVDLGLALGSCKGLLVRHGGHALAAGLSIEADRLREFASRFENEVAKFPLAGKTKGMAIDAQAVHADVTQTLVDELKLCGPFGEGNPEPVLAIEGARMGDVKVVGRGHLKFRLEKGGRMLDAIAFNMADKANLAPFDIDAAFVPQSNSWNSLTSVQLKVLDLRKSVR